MNVIERVNESGHAGRTTAMPWDRQQKRALVQLWMWMESSASKCDDSCLGVVALLKGVTPWKNWDLLTRDSLTWPHVRIRCLGETD